MSKKKEKGKSVSGVGGVVLFVIIVVSFVSLKMHFSPAFMSETKISDQEQQQVFEFLEIESELASIEKVEYSHEQDPVFYVYVSGLTEKDLEDKYTIDYYGYYVKNATEIPDSIKYKFIEDEGMRVAKFDLSLYDEILYRIVE